MLTIVIKRPPNHHELELTGELTELAARPLGRLATLLGANARWTLNCAGIDRVNSAGLVLWAKLLQQLPATARVELVECSVALVDALALAPSVLERSHVVSFYLPCRCTDCGRSLDVLVARASPGALPPCPRCACELRPEAERDALLRDGEDAS